MVSPHLVIVTLFTTSLLLSSCSGDSGGNDRSETGSWQLNADSLSDTVSQAYFVPDPTFGGNMQIYSASGPQNITRGVLKARNGTLWFGSWNGLYSYDGTTFTNHTLKDHLPRSRVYSVYEDSKGNIWAATAGAGVIRYDGTAFRNFSVRDGMPSNNVFVIFEDKSGHMWFGSDSGATQYDFKSFSHLGEKDSVPIPVYAFAEGDQGHIWIGTRRGTYEYYNNVLTPLKTGTGAMIPSLALLIDPRGRLWIAGSNGLYAYYHDVKTNKDVLDHVVPNNSTHLALDAAGNILFTCADETPNSQAGMYIFRYTSNGVDTVTQRLGQKGAGGQIFGAVEDEQGHIWFGTVQGVCEYNGVQLTQHYAK